MTSFFVYEIWDIICKHSIGWAGHSFYSVQPSFLNPNTSLKRTRPHKLICCGKWKHWKLPKVVFLELLHPKNFIRKLIVGTIAKDIVQGIIFSLRSKALALQGDFYKKVKKVKENTRTLFKTKTLFSNKISERQNNVDSIQMLFLDSHGWWKRKDDYEYKNCEWCPGFSLSVSH